MDVELRHFRAFAAVARERSFTRAAERLLITQPALTRTVQQLEAALQVQLLDRTSRHVELTEAGAEFLGHAERVLAAAEQALAAVGQQATVRLGFSWLLPDPWAQDAMTAFAKATGRSVQLARRDDPLDSLQQGAIDVAVVRGEAAVPAGVSLVRLFDEVRVAACSERSPLAGRAQLDWAEVPSWPLVVNTVSGTTGPWSWPDGAGPRQVVPVANYDEWLETVAADRGIGVCPETAMRRGHPAVRFIPLVNAPSSPVSLAFVPRGQHALIRRFVAAAVDAANQGKANLSPITDGRVKPI
jgi:DNA-binding transcriptional LysR family regulator